MSESVQIETSTESGTPIWARRIPMLPGSRYLWETIEILSPVAAGVSGGIAAVNVGETKWWAVTAGILAVFGLAVTKWTAKQREWRERDERSERERRETRDREQAIERLRLESANKGRIIAEKILDYFWKRYFHGVKGDKRHLHRVTLFRCVSCHKTGEPTHLEVYARAGVQKQSQTTWPVDENDPSKCRGIAALIWFRGELTHKFAVCDWSDTNNKQKKRFADSLSITVEEAESVKVKSKAFAGFPIIVRDHRWGVLLLDSVEDGFIEESELKTDLILRYAKILELVIEGTQS